METLLLLARETPMPREIHLAETLIVRQLPAIYDASTLVEFDGGVMVTAEEQQERGPKFFEPERIDDPLLQLHQQIADEMRVHFPLVRAVTFFHRGD